jgi:hypothetical protein
MLEELDGGLSLRLPNPQLLRITEPVERYSTRTCRQGRALGTTKVMTLQGSPTASDVDASWVAPRDRDTSDLPAGDTSATDPHRRLASDPS